MSLIDNDISTLGQVFTPQGIVRQMLALVRNRGRVLEPSCGDGAFSQHFPAGVALEIDPRHCPPGARNLDFFAYPVRERFATIIGNPPYVRFQDIAPRTLALLERGRFDARSNLYLFFIEKCLRHLEPGGELIFITPRDFLKSTSALPLNRLLYAQGTITDFIELGDAPIFKDASPNCAIWRFERDNFSRCCQYRAGLGPHTASESRQFLEAAGHLLLTRQDYPLRLADIAFVKVGAVSGADELFSHPTLGNVDFVSSATGRSGQTRRMIWADAPTPYLQQHKERLLARRVSTFSEANWWQWGRSDFISPRPRVYVNNKTRQPHPFFCHPCLRYDGAVLAVFPHRSDLDLEAFCAALNGHDWDELGYCCDGRFLFSQRSLEQAPVPAAWRAFLPDAV